MSRFKVMLLCAVTSAMVVLPSAAYAKASCWCRLGPTSSPYKDFGALATFGGQSGHDSLCHDLCSQTVTSWMANTSNYNTVCQAANWGSVAAYSSVGTRPWTTAWTATCHSPNSPAAGYLTISNFTPSPSLTVEINDVFIPVNNNTQQTIQIASTPLFTTFVLVVPLSFHVQSWTFTAQLYRDNGLVETLSRKSPTVSSYYAVATFTQQPNTFVHGHVWKIVWTYHGNNGVSSYSIP
jgi:hypothetical protein